MCTPQNSWRRLRALLYFALPVLKIGSNRHAIANDMDKEMPLCATYKTPVSVSALSSLDGKQQRCCAFFHLCLGHGGWTWSNTATRSWSCRQCREYERSKKWDKSEPQEYARRLSLVAAFAGIIRSIRDSIVLNVTLWKRGRLTNATDLWRWRRAWLDCHKNELAIWLQGQFRQSGRIMYIAHPPAPEVRGWLRTTVLPMPKWGRQGRSWRIQQQRWRSWRWMGFRP